MMKRYEVIGIILTLLGATLWGVSGTSVQFVGNFRNMNLEWLLTMRLITAGLLTVLYGWIRQGNTIFNVFRNWRDTLGLIIFGVFGMALCQYTYFRSIVIAGAGIGAIYDYHLFADALWQTAFYRRNHFSYPCFSRYYLLDGQ